MTSSSPGVSTKVWENLGVAVDVHQGGPAKGVPINSPMTK